MSDHHNHERIRVVYFINREGYIIIAPDQRHPTPEGFERREATHLAGYGGVDWLTAQLNRQDSDMFGRLMAKDREALRRKHTEIKAKLGQRLLAVDCSPIERMFILRMYRYMEEKERELLKCEVRGFFHQREYDSAGRDPIEQHGRQLEAVKPKISDRLASIMGRR